MDELDRASLLEMAYRDNMIAALSENSNVKSSSVCLDCGQPIPKERQLALKGCFRCVDCQMDAEARLGLGIRS